ncbi:MAG: response regulator transcription factor [Dehalococcoidia bacterium]
MFDLGVWTVDTAGEAILLAPVGLVFATILVHLVNAAAYLYARWAGLMLGSRARNIPPHVPTSPPLDDVPPESETPHDAVGSPAAPALASLTRREREVLRLIARGHSNAEIAEAFFVSEGPVKTHVKRVLAKLDVRDRTQAAVLAFNSGFVVPQTDAERTAEPAAPRERLALVR